MSGILAELASRHNLTANRTQAWGTVDGFWFQVGIPPSGSNVMKIRTSVNLFDEEAINTVVAGLVRLTRNNRNAGYARTGGSIVLNLKKPSGASAADKVSALLMEMVLLFRQAGAVPACYKCGAPTPDGFALVNGETIKLCAACQADIKNTFDEQAIKVKAHNQNNPLAYLGAVLGALVGSVAWILVGSLGWMVWFCGSIISVCSITGYRIMKGKVTSKAFLIIFFICLLVMALAQFALYDMNFCRYLASQGIQIDYFQIILKTFVIPFEYYRDGNFVTYLGFGVLFIGVGFLSLMRVTKFHTKAKAGKIERL